MGTVRFSLFAIVLAFTSVRLFAQDVLYGANQYIEYQVGTLPIVISVAHGGNLEPASIPNRTCNNPVYTVDAFTIETALEIKQRLFAMTGCYPHLIISHLKRNKLDPNRNLQEGACGNQEAMQAWQEFHNFISTARNTANQQFTNNTLFVDLHGHGNEIERIELGYLLYDDELALSDNTLNTNQYVNFSSIKNLVATNTNNYTHAQLLRGPFSFGTLLSKSNYPTVPSQDIPFPGVNTNYFSGGYITANHTSYKADVQINGFQMELNFSGIRNTAANRTSFANAFAKTIVEFMNTHFNMVWQSCTPLSAEATGTTGLGIVSPNPARSGELLKLHLQENKKYTYEISTVNGKQIASGEVDKSNTILLRGIDQGFYLLKVYQQNIRVVLTTKLVIQ
ncbi:MAG: T9SS type A sorting domain-containing protein [Chryseotalea sp.]